MTKENPNGLEKMADNVWIVLISRLSPILLTIIATLLWNDFNKVRETLDELEDITTALNASVVLAMAPRLENVENELRAVKIDITNRTASRFTREDAIPLSNRLSKLEQEVAAMKAVMRRVEQQ